MNDFESPGFLKSFQRFIVAESWTKSRNVTYFNLWQH